MFPCSETFKRIFFLSGHSGNTQENPYFTKIMIRLNTIITSSVLLQKLPLYQITLSSPCVPDNAVKLSSEETDGTKSGTGASPSTRTVYHHTRQTIMNEETKVVVTDGNGLCPSYASVPREMFSMTMVAEAETRRGTKPTPTCVVVAHVYVKAEKVSPQIDTDITTCISDWMSVYCKNGSTPE